MKLLLASIMFMLLFLLIPAVAQENRIRRDYDKFKDQTVLTAGPLPLKLSEFWITKDAYLYAGLIHPGSVLSASPDSINMLFMTFSTDWRFLKETHRSVIFLVDSEKISFDKAEYDGKISSRLTERLTVNLPLPTFRKIAYAQTVDVQLGGSVEVKIKEKELVTLRALYESFPSASARSSPPLGSQKIEWTFPKPGMATKVIGKQQYYDLGNEFYARFDILNDHQIVIVVLRSDLNALINNVNREQPGGIPNKEQFMAAVAVEKAVGAPRGEVNEYLGSGRLDGRSVYLYKARNGAIVGAAISDDNTFVILMPQKESV